MSEKYILTVKAGLHLGFIKESFGAGSIIEHDEINKCIIIDGRKFTDTRDLEILKRQALKNPGNPWIVPFSEELMEEIREQKQAVPVQTPKPRPGEHMQVIKSDSDLTDPVDIRDTQISKRNNEAKEAARNKVKSNNLPIIKGDETVEDRLASLKDKTDINSMAERVRLKQEGKLKMQVVQDDSLGVSVSKNAIPLNAGQQLPSRESIDSKADDVKAQANARKREIEAHRKASGIEVPSENAPEPTLVASEPAKEAQSVSEPTPKTEEIVGHPNGTGGVVGVEIGESDTDMSKEAEIASLKAKIASLEADSQKPIRKAVVIPARPV